MDVRIVCHLDALYALVVALLQKPTNCQAFIDVYYMTFGEIIILCI